MAQQLDAVNSKDKDRVYRIIRSVFYTVAGIMVALEAYVIITLFFIQISCQVYKTALNQVLQGMTFIGALLMIPLFLYAAIASARRKSWWHFGVILIIFVSIGIGFYSLAGKSIFYCFLDELPDMQFYIGPH